MRKTTKLESVKNMAISFLYFDIEETKFPPMVIMHPIFESAFVMVERGKFPINILESEDNLKLATSMIKSRIEKSKNVREVFFIIRQSYRYTFFKYIKNYLTEEDYGELLRASWVGSENPNQDVNVSVRESVRYFKKADKKHLMEKEEREYLKNLPDEVKVYRGVSVGREPNGLSYTDNLAMADWFSHRYDREDEKGYILEGTVKKENILAYFESENELVIDPRDIENLCKKEG